MAETKVSTITSAPGFSRDGTILDRNSYVDGQWTRFQRGKPRKMRGYKEISSNIDSVVRSAFVHVKGSIVYLYGFSKNSCWLSTTTMAGATSVAGEYSLPGLPDDDAYSYQSGLLYDAFGSGVVKLVVHPQENLGDISDETNHPIYMCDVGTNPATFTALNDGVGGTVEVSGGICILQPYVFAYGNNGLIKNCAANAPDNWVVDGISDANEVNVAGTKIVKGLPIRGGVNAPAGLFWALDSLIRVTWAGTEFRYDPVSSQISILAPNSCIEYDGAFYWLGIDRFFVFNGTVNELPNSQNYNWFFDNVNYNRRTKIFAIKNTRFGEIWWFFPFGEAEECTHALIYNVREGYWYDTVISRSAGFSPQVFRYPLLFGSGINTSGMYSSFIHEFKVDAIEGGTQLAIPAYFETSDFGLPTGGTDSEKPVGLNNDTSLYFIEPDFVMSGNMTVQAVGGDYAQGASKESAVYTFGATTGKISIRTQLRQIRLRFSSNELGGNFQMGRVLLRTEIGDDRS